MPFWTLSGRLGELGSRDLVAAATIGAAAVVAVLAVVVVVAGVLIVGVVVAGVEAVVAERIAVLVVFNAAACVVVGTGCEPAVTLPGVGATV